MTVCYRDRRQSLRGGSWCRGSDGKSDRGQRPEDSRVGHDGRLSPQLEARRLMGIGLIGLKGDGCVGDVRLLDIKKFGGLKKWSRNVNSRLGRHKIKSRPCSLKICGLRFIRHEIHVALLPLVQPSIVQSTRRTPHLLHHPPASTSTNNCPSTSPSLQPPHFSFHLPSDGDVRFAVCISHLFSGQIRSSRSLDPSMSKG